MDLGAAIRSYGGPVLFVWAWPREKRHPAIERARMLVRTHDSRVMLADALRVRDPLGHVMRAESWILLGALTLGVSAHWVSHRIGRKLTR